MTTNTADAREQDLLAALEWQRREDDRRGPRRRRACKRPRRTVGWEARWEASGRTTPPSDHELSSAARGRPSEVSSQEHAEQDQHQEHQVEGTAGGVVPRDDVLQHADHDAGGGDLAEVRHAAEHGGGQRADQQTRADGDRRHRRLGRGVEDGRGGGDDAGQHPDGERHTPLRHAEEPGRLHVLRRRSRAEADLGAGPERDDQQGEQGDDRQNQQLTGLQVAGRTPRRLASNGTGNGSSWSASRGRNAFGGQENLRQADGGDHDHQARGRSRRRMTIRSVATLMPTARPRADTSATGYGMSRSMVSTAITAAA